MIDTLLAAAAATSGSLGSPADMWGAIVHDFSNITSPAAFAAFTMSSESVRLSAIGISTCTCLPFDSAMIV